MAMNLTVSGKQIDIGEALRDHVQRSLDAAVAKYFDGALEGTVAFSRHAHEFRSDISVHVGRNIMAQSHGTAGDPYVAFEVADVAKTLSRAVNCGYRVEGDSFHLGGVNFRVRAAA